MSTALLLSFDATTSSESSSPWHTPVGGTSLLKGTYRLTALPYFPWRFPLPLNVTEASGVPGGKAENSKCKNSIFYFFSGCSRLLLYPALFTCLLLQMWNDAKWSEMCLFQKCGCGCSTIQHFAGAKNAGPTRATRQWLRRISLHLGCLGLYDPFVQLLCLYDFSMYFIVCYCMLCYVIVLNCIVLYCIVLYCSFSVFVSRVGGS